MKKHYLALSAAMLLAGAAHAQGTELFFSEYDEGAHQNGVSYNGGVSNSAGVERVLEIYNPTNNVVSLTPYSVRRYSNGSTTVVDEERLMRMTGANSLNQRTTHVYANGQATLTDIRAAANQYGPTAYGVLGPNFISGGGATSGNVTYFDGDDAIALVRYPTTAGTGTGVIVDLIGVIGERPVNAAGANTNWTGSNPIDGTPAVIINSANQSLIRRASVSRGVRTNPIAQGPPGARNPGGYDISLEWTMYSTAFNGPMGASNPGGQLYNRLGEHSDYAGPYGAYAPYTLSSRLEKFNSGISIYPNPASGTATIELKDVKVGSILVMNTVGQRIEAQPAGTAQQVKLDISSLKAGLYFVQFISADGQTRIYKEMVVK